MTQGLYVLPAGALDRVFEGIAVPSTPRGGLLGWGMCRTTVPTLTDRQASPIGLDTGGNLKTATQASPVGTYTLAAISFAASGDNTVIAGVAAQRIRIYHFNFIVAAATNVTLKDGATAKSGVYPFQPFAGLVFDAPGGGVTFDCSTAAAFVINNSNAVQVSGFILYTQS